ncbi:two-component system sensor histidine kinase UhpB [Mobiluncus mulieris]|uniref:histidine kinase n=1 Tax=Mobiluncus mulieris TaxID=2052 RepID=UPI0017ADD31A|nr:histidine kinase [Mobiluncus mulieris]MBB5845642.1 two-component system sensor histidine kinase UhpB [Mobiluncus mulieris]
MENWVWQGLLLYASTSAVLLIRAEDITLTLIFLCLQFAVSLIVGLLMRQQRDYTALLQGYLDSSGLAAEQIRSQLRRELAAQLHDTTAKDLAQISLAAQKLRDDPSSVTSEALAELASAASAAAKRIRPMILNLDISRESISLEKALVESRKMLTARGITLDVVVPKGTDQLLTRQQQLVASLVVRESASNILKYAPENSLASLELSLDEARNLSVYSQNRVAEHPDTSFTGGYGLRNLEDKITSEGGELLFGKSGDKWNLSVEIPFRKEKPGDR